MKTLSTHPDMMEKEGKVTTEVERSTSVETPPAAPLYVENPMDALARLIPRAGFPRRDEGSLFPRVFQWRLARRNLAD